MPCSAPPRGFTDTKLPWSDVINNNPCGLPTAGIVGGVDVSAAGLCRYHWQMKNGLVAEPPATVLLLHGDVAGGEVKSFPDASGRGHPVVAAGDAVVDPAQSVFGGGAIKFDGAGDVLTSPSSDDWNLGAGDFTFDFRIRFAALVGWQHPFGRGLPSGASKAYRCAFNTTGTLYFVYCVDGSTDVLLGAAWVPVVDTTYHVAFVRAGNLLYRFVNGTQLAAAAAITGAIFDNGQPLSIGGHGGAADFVNGWIDEFRVSKTARWTANFTPPAAPYT